MTGRSPLRTSVFYVLGGLLVALLALRSSGAEIRAETGDDSATGAGEFVDPRDLSFERSPGAGESNPFQQVAEGTTFECTYSGEVSMAYVPSPEELLGTDSANRRMSATNFEITYIGTWPSEAQAALERAVATWENMIDTAAPIRMTATWQAMSSGVLGSGGPWLYANFPDAPLQGTWYPAALANVLCGCDVDPNQYDFRITMNSAFANWHFGEGPAPSNKVDFQTTAMHELTHGLGFSGTARVTNGVGSYGLSGGSVLYPAAYDRFTEDNAGSPILGYTNNSTELAAVLQSNAVYFDGTNARLANGGNRAELYAPTSWNQGSSYSHFGNSFDNTPDGLLTYALSYGETLRDVGPVTKGVFLDIGWPFALPGGSLQFGSSTYNVLENVAGGTFNVPVTRTGGSAGAASATCSITGGTATSGVDFTLSSSGVSWVDGEAGTKSCILSITNDSAYEV